MRSTLGPESAEALPALLLGDSAASIQRTHQDVSAPMAPAFESPFDDRARASFVRPAVFDAWQDDQIRRQFGPMGIDTIIDLLRAPLARRSDSNLESEQALVLIGRGAWRWAPKLAEGLIQNGTPAFTIYVCDPSSAAVIAAEGLAQDHPIHGFLRSLPFPTSPESLSDSLSEIRPTAFISRDFLSSEASVEPWLDVLSMAAGDGTCLLFSERTGVAPSSPAAIGSS